MLYPESRWLDANLKSTSSCTSDDITALVEAVQQNWPVTEDRLIEIKSITYFIANGWPSHESAVPHSVRDYYRERALLSLNDGVVTYKPQVVMPSVLPCQKLFQAQRPSKTSPKNLHK